MQTSTVNSSTQHNQRNTWYAWLICIVASLFFFYEFLQLNIFDPITQDLAADFHIGPKHLGYLASMYFYGNFMMVIPAGMLLDRFSTKLLVLLALILCVASIIVFALTDSYVVAAVSRLIEGMGAGFCFLSCLRLASRWFSANRLAFVTGVVVTMAMLGGMVAQTPMALLTDAVGWRQAMLFNGFLGIFIMLLIFFIVKDRPKEDAVEAAEEHVHLKKMGVLRSLLFVVKNKYNWLGGIYTTLMNLPIFIIGALWGMLYLQQVHGLGRQEASYVTSMLFIGVVFGSPAFGWFSDFIHSRKIPMLIGAVTSLIVILIWMYTPTLSMGALMTLSFLLGFFTSSQVVSYPAIAELNPIELTGSATSIISLTIMFSGVVVQPLTGWLIQLHGDKVIDGGGLPVYLKQDYMLALAIIPVSFVLSFIVACFMKETGCRSEYDHLS
jgi:sugar phosphate permease